jgi:hypothetical protein
MYRLAVAVLAAQTLRARQSWRAESWPVEYFEPGRTSTGFSSVANLKSASPLALDDDATVQARSHASQGTAQMILDARPLWPLA